MLIINIIIDDLFIGMLVFFVNVIDVDFGDLVVVFLFIIVFFFLVYLFNVILSKY